MSSKINYDEVLFEFKDGTEYATLQADAFRAAMRERDMLRAEREVWANIAQERNDLRAEVERLEAQHEQMLRAYDQQRQEIKRLRAFAQKVALYCNDAWLAREADALVPGATLGNAKE